MRADVLLNRVARAGGNGAETAASRKGEWAGLRW